MALSRRQWIQKSLLASSAVLISNQTEILAKALPKYAAEDHPMLLLNWNENPYGPSPKAIAAITDVLQKANRYPDAKVAELKQAIARKNGLSPAEVMITAGSTEILGLLGQHVGLKGGEILTPWPSFPTLIRFGEVSGAKIQKVDLGPGQVIDLGFVQDSVNENTSLIFICNPNNPTSTELSSEDLKQFCRSIGAQVLICVDEAYIEYSKNGVNGSMVDLIPELPNLVVCRTFSKAYGLAGLRIGYALSQKSNIDALRKRHTGYEISAGVAPLAAALATMEDADFISHCIAKNQEGRAILYRAFDRWGVKYYDSSTNFVYAQCDRFEEEVVSKLKNENIKISQWPDIMIGHIRISIGKPGEMQQFVTAAEKYLV